MPVYQGNIGPDVSTSASSTPDLACSRMTRASLPPPANPITYIDGDKGELLYRGYPIEQLAKNCNFLETCYLLLYGELPNEEKADFEELVTKHTMVNEQMQFFLRGFRRDAHPMAVLTGLVGGMSAFYHDSTDITNPAPQHRSDPPDRQDAHAGRHGLQVRYGPALHVPQERPVVCRQLHAHDVRQPVREPGQPVVERALWTASSSCTPTTSKMPRPPPCVCAARPAPTPSPPSPLAWPACGALPTAAPTKPA
jgi:hypothetical protein